MNVVLVTVDSLRADHCSSYGYGRETSPALDALAAEGLAVDAYANANATRASFPSILTSTYPLAYGGFKYLSDRRTMLGTPLQEAGYATSGFHSNVWLSRDFNYDRGFDRFYDSKSDPGPMARLRTFLKTNLDQDGLVYRTLQSVYDRTERQAGIDVGQTYKDAETITDRALEWIDDAPEPFFCWVHYMDVHHPYVPRPSYAAEMGVDLDIGEREAIRLRRKMLERPHDVTDEERQVLVDLYDAEIRYADEQIGRLVEAVRETAPETTFCCTSDHGEEFYEHGGYSHNPSMYDEVIHVPLVLAGAGVEGRVDATHADSTPHPDVDVELLDVAPTVHDLAGVDPPGTYVGRSVFDRVRSGESATVISETENDDGLRLAVRRDGWKYIWDQGEGTEELYDLAADPGERENVVEADARDPLRAHLEAHVEELAETNESLPEVRMDAETERRLKDLGYLE
jgi:arylsulfatase A-like enzyme